MARIAVPLAGEFEDSEFSVPVEILENAGHSVTIIGSEAGKELTGLHGKSQVAIDVTAKDQVPDSYDAVLIPGGHSPDTLRLDEAIVLFTRDFAETGKPIAAICHGPQLLIEAEAVRGKTLTSWPSIRTDLINAGAIWVDKEVVIDGNLITSRKPEDLDAFCEALLAAL